MEPSAYVIKNKSEFLKFLRSKFTLIHLSNIFFRDFHYGVMSYLSDHGIKLRYHDAEKAAREAAEEFEKSGILKRIDFQSWKLNYPDFALPRTEKTAEKTAEKKAS